MKAEWDEERFTQLLRTKSYQQLTPAERKWIEDALLSAEEYEQLRNAELTLQAEVTESNRVQVNPVILERLKEHLQSGPKRASSWGYIFTYRVPAYVVASCVMLTFGITWLQMAPGRTTAAPPSRLTKMDTVFLPSAIDTIFVEKVVYRDRFVKLPAVRQVNVSKSEKVSADAGGITMKDKEELEELLVSGTY